MERNTKIGLDPEKCYLISSRAYYLGFDNLAVERQPQPLHQLQFDVQEIDTIDYNKTEKLVLWLPKGSESKLITTKDQDILDNVDGIRFVGIQFVVYGIGSIVANSIFQLEDNTTERNSNDVERINTNLFAASTSVSRAIYAMYEHLKQQKVITPSSIFERDIISEEQAVDLNVFCDEMDWRAWNMVHVLRYIPTDVGEQPKSFSHMPWRKLHVSRCGSTFYGKTNDKETITNCSIDFLDIPNFSLTERSIYASSSINLERLGRNFLSSSVPTIGSARLRQYLVQVRLTLSRCDLYQISAAAENQDLFLWFEKNLSSFEHGKRKFQDLQSIIAIAIESRDAQALESSGRSVNAIFLVFTSLAFISVVASALGFIDFENDLNRTWRMGALALSILMSLAVTVYGLLRMFRTQGK